MEEGIGGKGREGSRCGMSGKKKKRGQIDAREDSRTSQGEEIDRDREGWWCWWWCEEARDHGSLSHFEGRVFLDRDNLEEREKREREDTSRKHDKKHP